MKYRILETLRDHMPEYVSGEALSRGLNVSRTAVWKYINELRQEGYVIDSVTKRGYRLVSLPDRPDAFGLSSALGTSVIGRKVVYMEKTDSTNIQAKAIAAAAEDGTVVAAGRQTAGRGRLGREWDSPAGTGIYLSVILKPEVPPEEVQLITLAASVAVASALRETAGVGAGIKWPNDVLLDGRKVCGILTEMSSEMERVNFVVLGIGLNYSQKREDFPEELQDKAVSVAQYLLERKQEEAPCNRTTLARAVLTELDELYKMLLEGRREEIVCRWKQLSVTLGKDVAITGKGAAFKGKAVDITADGRLVVLCEDGTRRELLSGEVSVRGLLGYS